VEGKKESKQGRSELQKAQARAYPVLPVGQ